MSSGPSANHATGVLRSITDLPKKEALGIELRRCSAYAAPVSVTTGKFKEEPLLIAYELGSNAEANKKTIRDALTQIMQAFSWKGVVGCSSSVIVDDRLGGHLKEVIAEHLESLSASFVHFSRLSDASAYYELVWGSNAAEECWKDKLVLVCNLGADVDMTLLHDGRRIQNCRGPLCKDTVQSWRERVAAALCTTSAAPDLPSPGGADWEKWVGALDKHLADAVTCFSGDLDRIIVVPSGRLARDGALRLDTGRLTQLAKIASELGCVLSLPELKPGTEIEGAALSAVVELQTEQLLKQLKPLLKDAKSLQALSEAQIRTVFERLDTSGDGQLVAQELLVALELLGIPMEVEAFQRELDTDKSGSVDINEFVSWWQRCVASAKVVTITSLEAWHKLLAEEPPASYGDLVLLEVTFTFCRSCRAFEPKFQKLAEEYPTIRFVNLVGNGTIGALEFSTQELNVKASPAFFVFRRSGELMASWVGKTPETLNQRLSECLAAAACSSVPA